MNHILKRLFTGEQRPFGEILSVNPAYKEACEKMEDIEAEIIRQFPESASLIERYRETLMMVNALSEAAELETGFRAGAQIMLEALKPLE